jgi:hypothetical protein
MLLQQITFDHLHFILTNRFKFLYNYLGFNMK